MASKRIGRHSPEQSRNGKEHSWRRAIAGFGRRTLSVTLSALLVLQPVVASAGGKVTPAAGSNAPRVGTAPNGVPLVDIVKPNGKGLSHNKYKDFNVDKPGLILNNHNKETGTSNLGGITPGNSNLAGSAPAAVILNEVTSNNSSSLNGPVEVFGKQADVIIANPNSITCDGCGFINTPRATLTTGVPNVDASGRLQGFTVNGGDVTFGSKGGNFASGDGAVDLFDVVSRTVHVNGPVYGKDVRLTAGRNKYDYADGTATALQATSGTPEFAIDGSALGAMQADRIKIVVTEKGAGVRMRGNMAANAGELSLSSDGKISIGNASGKTGVNIRSKGKVEARKLTSRKRVIVQAGKGITLESVAADGDVTLSSGVSLLSIAGAVTSLGSIDLTSGAGILAAGVDAGGAVLAVSSGNIALSGVARAARGDLTLSSVAGTISAASLASSANMSLNAGLDLGVSGNVFAGGDITISAKSIGATTIASGIDFDASAASPSGAIVLATAGDLKLTASVGSITASTLLSAGSLNIRSSTFTAGNVTSHGNTAVMASTNVSGQILGGADVLIDGASIEAGAIASGLDFAATAASSGDVVLGSYGNLTLVARSGDVDVGALLSASDLAATAAQNIKTSVTSHADLALTAGETITLSGQSLVTGNAAIKATAITVGGLVTGVDFAATAASATGDLIVGQTGTVSLDATAGSIKAGELLSGGDLAAHATGSISYDSLQSFGSALLDADHGSISIDKATKAAGNITLATKSVDLSNGHSGLATAQRLIINAQTADFSGSTLTFGGLQLDLGGAADFSGSKFRAVTADGGSGDIAIKAISIDMTSSTTLLAANDLMLTLPSLINPGQIAAGDDLTLNIAGDLINTATGLIYAGDDTMLRVVGHVRNDRGAIMAGRHLTIAANVAGGKNSSITNISGLIRADGDITVATDELINKRLATPIWSKVLVSSGVVSSFELNPGVAGLPFAYLRDTGEYSIHPGHPTSHWSDYEPLLFSVAKVADGTSYRAWTWISGKGPNGRNNILDWLLARIPTDGNGVPILDANNPPRYFILEFQASGPDPSTTYDWDEAANLSQTVHDERFDLPLSPEALIHSGRDLVINATELNNAYSSIEAEGDVTLKGSVLNNEGVALRRTTLTTCNAQGPCEAYDADGKRDPSKDISQGASILTDVRTISSAAGSIKAGGKLDIGGFSTVNNDSAPGSIAGSAILAPIAVPGTLRPR